RGVQKRGAQRAQRHGQHDVPREPARRIGIVSRAERGDRPRDHAERGREQREWSREVEIDARARGEGDRSGTHASAPHRASAVQAPTSVLAKLSASLSTAATAPENRGDAPRYDSTIAPVNAAATTTQNPIQPKPPIKPSASPAPASTAA